MIHNAEKTQKSLEMLLKYDGAAPRYTSYPPANFFTQDPADADYEELLYSSNHQRPENLSFYVHIPFCPHRCLFCGCHTEIGRSGSSIVEYLETLSAEFWLLLPYLDRSRPLTQIHFGGGTPNSVPLAPLQTLLRAMIAEFKVSPFLEIAMECDPSLVGPTKLEQLREMGVNRISFGIQDLNPRVLQAVERRPSHVPLRQLVQDCHELAFTSVNLDLIYGLPYQTPESFQETMRTVLEANPDRISLFPYAHVPWVKGHQTALERYPMPDSVTRCCIAMEAQETLLEAGYVAIGMDHFVRPEEDLAVARWDGFLNRNFQGYCSQSKSGQVYALGASGITQLSGGYLQNEKDLIIYRTRVEAGNLPVRNVYRMTPRDRVVRSIINGLLCQGCVDFERALTEQDLDSEWKADYRSASALHLAPYIAEGLASVENGLVRITESGFPLARRIATAFDPLTYKNGETSLTHYSRAL